MVSSDVTIHQPNGPVTPPQMQGDQEAGLLDILAIVRRRRWLIVFGFVVGVGLGTLYFFKATPMYESKVEILVMPKDSNLPSQNGAGGSDFQQQSAGEDILATHIQLFQSPRVVQQAFEKNKLGSLPSLAEVIGEEDNPIKHIIENLEVTRGGEGKAKTRAFWLPSTPAPRPTTVPRSLTPSLPATRTSSARPFRTRAKTP
jgi:uncharacterized protein involved in exopolysaccharide biosynthesis